MVVQKVSSQATKGILDASPLQIHPEGGRTTFNGPLRETPHRRAFAGYADAFKTAYWWSS
jgi:hypothetical protein